MIAKFDAAAAYAFAPAAASLLHCPFGDEEPGNYILVMFSFGPAGGRPGVDDHLARADAEWKAIVHLEFKPGKERDGPCNVVVVTQLDGKWRSWPKCDLWSDSDMSGTGRNVATIIMPKGENFCFTYDGADLWIVPGRPTDSFAIGVARARKNLKFLVAQRARLIAKIAN
jgi:hypothetical protein